MKAGIAVWSTLAILVGGCASGGVRLGVRDAHDARTQCASQSARQQMAPEQQRQFMHTCMAGYGYESDTQESRPFTVKMPTHQRQSN